MTPFCAFFAAGDCVQTFMPSVTGRRARGQGLGRLLDLHQAHAAVGRDRELPVVAEVRHVRRRACWWRPSRSSRAGLSTSLPSTVSFEHQAASLHLSFDMGAPDAAPLGFHVVVQAGISVRCDARIRPRKCLMKLFTGSAAASPRRADGAAGDVVGDAVEQRRDPPSAPARPRSGCTMR